MPARDLSKTPQASCINVMRAIGFAVLVGSAATAAAAPSYLTFRVDSVLDSAGIDAAAHIGLKYIVKTEFDESIARASRTEAAGSVTYYNDTSDSDRFYAKGVLGNYVSPNDGANYHASSPADHRLGAWTTFDTPVENVFGSGPTYGKFNYSTRAMLATGSFDDLVQIDGFWADKLAPSLPASFLSPNAIWMIYDRDYDLNGRETYGAFWASLVEVSPFNPVPEPSTSVMVAAGLAALFVRTRRRLTR